MRTIKDQSIRHLLGLADELDMTKRQESVINAEIVSMVLLTDTAALSIAAALRKIAADVRDL